MAMRRNRRRRRGGSGRAGLVLFLLVALIAGAVVFTRVFVVKHIETVGQTTVPASDIVALSGIVAGENIFRIDEQKVSRNFDGIGKLSFEGIETKMPDTVRIMVRERVPRALMSYAGLPTLMDERGYAVEQMREMPEVDLPVVTGLRASSCQVGRRVQSEVVGQVDAMCAVISEIYTQQLSNMISELNVNDLDNMYLMMRSGQRVNIGDSTSMADKLVWMVTGLNQVAAEGWTDGVLDVSGGTKAFWLPLGDSPVAAATPAPDFGVPEGTN